MKKLFLAAVLLLITSNISSQTIGFMRNAQYCITANLDPIKAEWEKLLLENKTPAILTDFTITAPADKVTGNTYYLLLAQNRDKTIKVARALKMKAGYLSFITAAEGNPTGILTCIGCSSGCFPTIVDGKWLCDMECSEEGKVCESAVLTTTK